VRTLAEKTRVATNDLLALINALLTGNDWLLIGKAVAALWVIGWVGRVITPMGLLYTGVCCVLLRFFNSCVLQSFSRAYDVGNSTDGSVWVFM
jgi:hypothetical protein